MNKNSLKHHSILLQIPLLFFLLLPFILEFKMLPLSKSPVTATSWRISIFDKTLKNDILKINLFSHILFLTVYSLLNSSWKGKYHLFKLSFTDSLFLSSIGTLMQAFLSYLYLKLQSHFNIFSVTPQNIEFFMVYHTTHFLTLRSY